MHHQVIDLTQKKFRRKISPDLTAQAASNGDGLERKFGRARRNIATAPLAGNHKHLSVCGPLKHGISIGEQTANV
jgi:hypothetical protein